MIRKAIILIASISSKALNNKNACFGTISMITKKYSVENNGIKHHPPAALINPFWLFCAIIIHHNGNQPTSIPFTSTVTSPYIFTHAP